MATINKLRSLLSFLPRHLTHTAPSSFLSSSCYSSVVNVNHEHAEFKSPSNACKHDKWNALNKRTSLLSLLLKFTFCDFTSLLCQQQNFSFLPPPSPARRGMDDNYRWGLFFTTESANLFSSPLPPVTYSIHILPLRMMTLLDLALKKRKEKTLWQISSI